MVYYDHISMIFGLAQFKKYTIHQKKPCQVDWQKLVFPVKFDSVEEKLSFVMNTKQDEKSTFLFKKETFCA